MNSFEQKLLSKGYAIIKSAISKKLIEESKKIIFDELKILSKSKSNNLYDLITLLKKRYSQHEIQVLLARKLYNSNMITKILLSERLNNTLRDLLGADLEYNTEFELAINIMAEKNPYYLKKYHQEFWSGVGLNSLLLWIPINLKSGMGTMEVVENSHTWGHIPHQNREPINIPEHKSHLIKCKETSVVAMTCFTLHRSVPNIINEPRIAIPMVVRNFYYPTTGNEDLWSFKKYNFSFYTNFRRILGNPHFSPYRTLNSDRNNLFDKQEILKK